MEIHQIKTITGEFEQYMSDSYEGQEVSPQQREECRKAFFCGALALMSKMELIGDIMPDAAAIPVIQIIRKDVISTCQKFAQNHCENTTETPSNN
jgi:hypothetical protein